MSATDKLFRDDLSEAEMKSLSQEELALWIIRPKDHEISGAKKAMIARVSLLIALTLYYYWIFGTQGGLNPLLVLLFCYEFAYYNLRKEKAKSDYAQANSRYYNRVKEFERKRAREQ